MILKMKKYIALVVLLLILVGCNSQQKTKNDLEWLEQGFQNPSIEARPRGYWVWPKGHFDKESLKFDVKQAAEKGMGGLEIFDINSVDMENKIPAGPGFMSKEFLEGVRVAEQSCEKYGIDLGLIISSSWNTGGEWIPDSLGTIGLFQSEVTVTGPKEVEIILPDPEIPDFVIKNLKKINRDTTVQNYHTISVSAIKHGKDSIINTDEIISLTSKYENGTLTWKVPEGDWKIIRSCYANTWVSLKLPSPNSKGLVIDHFRKESMKVHLDEMTKRLKTVLGDSLGNTALDYYYMPSYEINFDPVWTPAFANEFKKRRGYDIQPFLPLFTGVKLNNPETEKRFWFDYRLTLSDLIIENHYQYTREYAENIGLGAIAEAGGPGPPLHNCPFESLKALGSLTVPRGEFWVDHKKLDEDGLDLLQVVKAVACAANIYDQKIVEGEAFTGLNQWQFGPDKLKPIADEVFCEGLNRFVFHVFSHSPLSAGEPGYAWQFGTQINPHRVWWPMAKSFIDYLSRISYLMQQGNFVGDVLFYYGHQAPNFVKQKHVIPGLGFGYDYDVLNTEILLEKLTVENGKLVLPNGLEYEILVLPDQQEMNPEVAGKIEQLVKAGATIVGPKPLRSHSLHNQNENDKEVAAIGQKVWGKCNGNTTKENTYGKGKVYWNALLKDVMQSKNVFPDFSFTGGSDSINLDFIHRSLPGADIYFIANKSDGYENIDGVFRIKNKVPEIWNPHNGRIQPQFIFADTENGVKMPILLEPKGSAVVVFRNGENNAKAIEKVVMNGQPIFPVENESRNTFVHSAGQSLSFHEPGNYVITYSNGETEQINIPAYKQEQFISNKWKAHFPEEKGGAGDIVFDSLLFWNKHDNPGVKYFSGIATYENEIKLPAKYSNKEKEVILDLGQVKEVARVFVNNKEVAVAWHNPYRVNISEFLEPGTNDLKIEVANTWHNRLHGDGLIPKDQRITNTNITKGPTTWWKPWHEMPLLNAGLKGPVRVSYQYKYNIN